MPPTTNTSSYRTNVSPTGYSYGGNDYKYEQRKDSAGNNYQVDIMTGPTATQTKTLVEPNVYKTDSGYVNTAGQSISYTPAFQSTSMQDRKDENAMIEANRMTANPNDNPNAFGPNQTQTQTPATGNIAPTGTNPDGSAKVPTQTFTAPDGKTSVSETPISGGYAYKTPTTLKEGEKTGYGADGKRYIIGKDGKVKNDTFADQEYEANKESIKADAERNTLYESIKSRSDAAHAALLDATKAQAAVAREKMKETNERFLALKTNEGFSGGQARYMSDINNGVLQDNIQKGDIRLAELDAIEKMTLAKIESAKTDKDMEALYKHLDEMKALRKEKSDAIQTVYKAANDFNKAIDEQRKEVQNAEKAKFEQGIKTLTASGPALLGAYDSLKDNAEKEKFLTDYAKKLGVQPEMVLGSIEDQRTQSSKDGLDIAQKTKNLKKVTGGGSGGGTGKLTVTQKRSQDISEIVSDFQNTMKTNNWKGANPDAYNYYKKEILKLYGTAGVNELNKAMESLNIRVDTTK